MTGEKRKKFCYIGAPKVFRLELALQKLSEAYGDVSYVVGSCLERPDWRDVDVVMILDDDDFAKEFPDTNAAHCEFDTKWLILVSSISWWLSQQTELPIDFKFQQRTKANNDHKGRPRHAKGLRIANKCGEEVQALS